jgi:hypothetical protein
LHLLVLEWHVLYDHTRKQTINKTVQASKTNVLVKTIAWTPRTPKPELGWKSYGLDRSRGYIVKELGLQGVFYKKPGT